MRPAWIRGAAVAAFLQGVAHGGLIAIAKPNHGPAEVMVVAAMRDHLFNFAGAWRSYWQLYLGYALLAAGVCLVEAALLWLIAPLAATDAKRLASIVVLLIVANAIHAAIIMAYFFYLPLVADALVIVLLGVSLRPVTSRRHW